VDGIFISPVYRMSQRAAIYEELRQRKVPTVLMGQTAPFCDGFVSVATDDVTSSMLMTKHLIELGHRRILFLAGPQTAPWAAERFDGYRRALRDANIELDDRLIYAAGATIEEGVHAGTQLLSEGINATALLASNDLVAIGAANTLLDQGVRIPEDLSVAGFGNILTAEFFRVPLSTVRQPKLRLGSAAMDLMLQLLRGEAAESRRLSAELILRKSTVPPRATA
jgi:DNA-binding LacI/PurR family transcriptional regulator